MSSSTEKKPPFKSTPECPHPDQLICDALYVARELAHGEIPSVNSAKVAEEDLGTVQKIAGETLDSGHLEVPAAIALENALSRIFKALSPVTLTSLRDTDPNIRRYSWIPFRYTYEANVFSLGLFATTLVFVAISVFGEFMERYFGPPLEQTIGFTQGLGIVLQSLTPFTYGAIGACVYLLRVLHSHIYERTYDRRRCPEYVNRILLGSVSGGAIVLLVDQITNDSGEVIHLSSAALGFLAGYNTDLLFGAVERISNAILPRIDINSPKRRKEMVETISIADLLDRMSKATTAEEKAFLQKLIDKIQP